VRELVEIISNLPEKEEAALLSILDKVLMRYRYGERAKAGKNTDGDVGRPRAGGTKKN
jgi:hypothetical protein